jgi:DNA polymerase elongation subunit (family B)
MIRQYSFRLLSFDAKDVKEYDDSGSFYNNGYGGAKAKFSVQMFGVSEKGKTACINVKGYAPFFYVKVEDDWTETKKTEFVAQMSADIGSDCITAAKLIKRKKLYEFDGGKKYNFIQLSFQTEAAMKKAKGLWYLPYNSVNGGRRLNPEGYLFEETSTLLYEANIPPLLRLFHIKEISPSGWIGLPSNKAKKILNKKKSCDYEFSINYKDIIPLSHRETMVPYKICSFDIEASSSHGDFPLPVKNYAKLANNIIDICAAASNYDVHFIRQIVIYAFKHPCGRTQGGAFDHVEPVYTKEPISEKEVEEYFNTWIQIKPIQYNTDHLELDCGVTDIEQPLATELNDGEDGNEVADGNEGEGADAAAAEMNEPSFGVDESSSSSFSWQMFKAKPKSYKKRGTIIDLLTDDEIPRDTKRMELTRTLTSIFPALQGDNVTFIGSTFMRYGDSKPYLNHCIARDTCDPVEGAVIESYKTEKEVLLAWTDLIQKENPDIIIGYNIFGFDYQFMFLRAKELGCERAFLQLSRNKGEVCLKRDWRTGKESLEENTIVIASGQHDLKFVKMTGRLQIDLYNYFRRDYQLQSYKLDYVSGYFIGDAVKRLEHIAPEKEILSRTFTKIYSKNLTGLENGSFIILVEEAHTSEPYKNGKKFEVHDIDYKNGSFMIDGKEEPDILGKKVKWGLAKDDVTPQDIFRMTNEGPKERAIIAKYCIQDCNLVHHLMKKIDVITGYSEMASLCSVPMDFLVMRGQSIKLTSFVAKKCREKGTLMPVIDKSLDDDGYEGATVLEPKCGLYLDDSVACLDYGSLYPSSMISENISHDSKISTREYNLQGELIKETGEKIIDPVSGLELFKYDNLPGYEYVDITYNTYKWQRKNGNPKAGMEKVKVGYKVCRYAQFPDDPNTGKPVRGIMPAILEELLAARKATRKLIETHSDEFMKNILDKRQLSIKVTANSLYGQTGAKTSSFYDKDCAASTTATGRKLLIYGKRVIEEAYANAIVPTKDYGNVKTNAEYIYGDTDSVFFKFNLQDVETGEPIIGQKGLEITIELAQQAGELATKFLKKPHDLEYEKTFLPFCLLSKKRYCGMLHEFDPNKCKRKSMGIVLNRRDNAPIVKDVYGGIMDILMQRIIMSNSSNLEKAIEFLKGSLQNIVDEKYPMDKLIITKALRSGYKNPAQIAHKVLADRIARRDPGNKPNIGDRIPFVYIENPNKKALQGDRIETPDFILANKGKVKINYSHYITNQIMKPVQQLFALVLEQMKDFKKKKGHTLHKWRKELEALREEYPDEEKYKDKVDSLRNKEVKALLFDPYLRRTNNMKNGNNAITNFFA